MARVLSTISSTNSWKLRRINVAVFEKTGEDGKVSIVEYPFDFLHAVPLMTGHDYLKSSGLADANNFVKVDKATLRSESHKNVWCTGDGSNLPTARTMAAVIDQSIILTNQLENVLKGTKHTRAYDGYTCCPLLVGNKKVMMAEFKYGLKIAPSFHPDQRKPTRYFYWMKQKLFPFANKYLIKHGLWNGRKTLWDASALDYSAFQAQEEFAANKAP
jgi:NADPH-dependent 2,4-dienoyl-CoA reductase/sulfur reductase-like enzyme